MFGLALAWHVVAVALDVYDRVGIPSPAPSPATTPVPSTIPPPTTVPPPTTPPPTTLPPRVPGNIKLPPYTPLSPVPTAISCPRGRQVKAGETVYMTMDDGPSVVGRQNLLEALDQTPFKVTFFESGYNFCGPETKYELTLQCKPEAKPKITELSVWTIKKGHVLASHSDTHFYDEASTKCEYAKMAALTKIADKYASCGSDATSDFVRGALHFQEAWANDTLWDTKEELAQYARQLSNIWSLARLPCTNVWRVPGKNYKWSLYGAESGAEQTLRTGIADQLVGGSHLACKNETFQGKPWAVFGWDIDWRWDKDHMRDLDAEKCRIVQAVEHNFDGPNKDGARRLGVVVLAHDYHYSTKALATMFRDTIVELKLRGYNIDTMDNYKFAG
ncbi:hypothetical protein SDRG_04927 [Saprolegnia diclina VS20]|uniref:NodB homology domain-containing protein n=1 Tax=Saprolegnia diclina (strain VS20) TaxID=1156394 RepID=T0QIU3_SAPDV|nr:hypothetical protein SDRG_04927 [Saprolegnia diclina VS20]EQC37909.1 hypothetical protein SDRG_04927 [Saprolegnia diclina VS20]|eukprot:XP_008608842.1 hypothetical protein SDRG_04927 [Saprolegnia diclina VS20]